MLHHMATMLVCYGGHFESKMATKIQKSSDLDEIWFQSRVWCCELISIVGLLWRPFWIQNGRQKYKDPPISAKFGFHVDFLLANWYPSSFFWNWEPCYDPSDHIISCYYYYYYYYYSSSSSPNELVRPNSQRLMIRSLLNFTGRWIPISRVALTSWNFQNGRRCHGNREHMSKSLTSFLSETAEGISTRLGIYIKQGWYIILTK